jgi:hypothetical protein
MTRTTRVPLPDAIPGRFFVLAFERGRGTYLLLLDTEPVSSYRFPNIATALTAFKRWGMPRLGADAIDIAREFGAVQGIPKENRTISLKSEFPKLQLVFEDGADAQRTYIHI